MPTRRKAPQIIRSDGADELVVLTRSDYDALLAAAGDPEAEQRAVARIGEATAAAIAAGDEHVLPDWLALATARGEAPLKVVRRRLRHTQQEIASACGVTQGFLSEVEGGRKAPNAAMRARLAAALGVDPAWLDPVGA